MLLHLEFTDSTGDLRNFFVFSSEIEKQLDVLNSFVENGLPVHSAQLTSTKGHVIVLPVGLFAGRPIREQISELKTTYKMLLDL